MAKKSDTATAGATAPDAAPLPTSYEAARDELAGVVDKLEAGGLSLDDSLNLWERGQALAAACEKFLAGARKRVDDALAAEAAESTVAAGSTVAAEAVVAVESTVAAVSTAPNPGAGH